MCPCAEAGTGPRAAERRNLCNRRHFFGGNCPIGSGDTDRSRAYVLYMLSTLLVIGGVLTGLLVLLALIVSLSARPQTAARPAGGPVPAPRSWVADAGRPHPDAWSPLSTTTSEMPAIR
jgi:hypothetical protein